MGEENLVQTDAPENGQTVVSAEVLQTHVRLWDFFFSGNIQNAPGFSVKKCNGVFSPEQTFINLINRLIQNICEAIVLK